jgi:hypothetical protein
VESREDYGSARNGIDMQNEVIIMLLFPGGCWGSVERRSSNGVDAEVKV